MILFNRKHLNKVLKTIQNHSFRKLIVLGPENEGIRGKDETLNFCNFWIEIKFLNTIVKWEGRGNRRSGTICFGLRKIEKFPGICRWVLYFIWKEDGNDFKFLLYNFGSYHSRDNCSKCFIDTIFRRKVCCNKLFMFRSFAFILFLRILYIQDCLICE